MAYRINVEMLGAEATDGQARRMVELLSKLGHEVEYTADGGLVNGMAPEARDDSIPDAEWDECLRLASGVA